MIYCIGHNIYSPLGVTSQENFDSVRKGKTGLRYHEHLFGMPEPCYVSLIEKDFDESVMTKFEQMMIFSVEQANAQARIDLSAPTTLFIISTTKGNVSFLRDDDDERVFLWHSARKIARHFGNGNEPVVVSNACISGAAAQVEALRLLDGVRYRNAVVAGGDVLSKFIISGFQSFKALSPERCKPFDKDRKGLNLGEAAATIIYSCEPNDNTEMTLVSGAVRNDARHISAPSIEAEGLFNALTATLEETDLNDIAFVNAHGTATIYNDEMEALALNRMSMQDIPTNSLKAYFGHTLGAAGVLETIISMMALHEGIALESANCNEPGAKHDINLLRETTTTDKNCFVKMVSGFGGGNASILVRKFAGEKPSAKTESYGKDIISYATLYHNTLNINGKIQSYESHEDDILTAIYRANEMSYPKFFKMDHLSKAGFIVSELMLRDSGFDIETPKKDFAIALFNRSASSDDDLAYLRSICDPANYYPSPSVFVYTLPNIVAGEIAIRNKILGETSFYVTEDISTEMIEQQIDAIMQTQSVRYVLCGWVEYFKTDYKVCMILVEKINNKSNNINIKQLWKI